ncbi:hypothetical protein Y032_0039g93 [Ancylostoma ceylanicum]|nr:hypothetical protein Y032_0039g93 [Ancylostoma ceylanicum]
MTNGTSKRWVPPRPPLHPFTYDETLADCLVARFTYMTVDGFDLSAASKSTLRGRAARAEILTRTTNHRVFSENPDSPLRRRFHCERRGRAVCFSKPWKGHRHRCRLYVGFSEDSFNL